MFQKKKARVTFKGQTISKAHYGARASDTDPPNKNELWDTDPPN